MGMGWHTVRSGYTNEEPCSTGKGLIITTVTDEEESEYPPFERGGDSYTRCQCSAEVRASCNASDKK